MCITRPRPRSAVLRDTCSLLGVLRCYWPTLFRVAREELTRWRRRAQAIPDAALRRHACETLAGEQMNAEGAALFAVLAAPGHCRAVARLLVAFQVMYDYLDTLTEQPVQAPLANSRRLHRALAVAVGAPRPRGGYYAHHPSSDDGGYLDAMVAVCRTALERLPAASAVMPSARRAVQRSAEGQSRNHAALTTGVEELASWSSSLTPPESGFEWWELAAGAGSSLAIHVLLAAAGDPAITVGDAERIAAAYWPLVNALNTLLESLVDRDADAETANHSYVSHYATPEAMAERLGAIAIRASRAMRGLPRGETHATILAAMASFYLSTSEAQAPDARMAARRVRAGLDIDPRVLLAVMRLRRRFERTPQDASGASSSNASACRGRTTLK
jgi:tetraprenyl-beta-curcumene synthase